MAGNQGNNKIIWQPWQEEFLKKNWRVMTAQQLSDALGIKRTKVREKKYQLGFYSIELEYWTEEQVKFLKDNYRHYGDTELAEMFTKKWTKKKGWNKKHIEKKRRYLGLKRTFAEKKALLAREVKKGTYHRANKRLWEIRGAAPIDEVRVWFKNGIPVKMIKTEKIFVHYARWLYEKEFGKVPDGKVVRLKDLDPMNVVPENLFLTTRAEHAVMNSSLRNDIRTIRQRAKNELQFNIYKIKKLQQCATN